MASHDSYGTPRSSAAIALGRAMRMDLATASDNGVVGNIVNVGLPMFTPVLAIVLPVESVMVVGAVLTPFYWAMSVAALFLNTSHQQSGRLTAVMPVSRSRQVAGRYLSALVCGMLCCVEMLIQFGVLRLVDPSAMGTPAGMLAVIGLAMAAFVIVVAMEMPFFYAFEFSKASSWFWTTVFVIGAVMVLATEMLPDAMLESLRGTIRQLPAEGCALAVTAACLLAVGISYAASRTIWLRKEL